MDKEVIIQIIIGGAGFAAFMFYWGLPFIFNGIVYLGS